MKVHSIEELANILESYGNEELSSFQFSTKILDEMRTFKNRVKYCKDNLKYIGRGSSRMAFMMPNGHVIKLAFNRKGIAQNEVEAGDYVKNQMDCFAKCYNCANDYTWLEVEAAARCYERDFPRLLGITFNETLDVIVSMYRQRVTPNSFRGHGIASERTKEIEQKVWDDPEKHDVLYDLFEYIGNYDVGEYSLRDLWNIRNWGIVVRDGEEKLVITDSGLNDEVWNNYYRRNW